MITVADLFDPSVELHVIVAFPRFLAVIRPVFETVAILELLVDQVTTLFAAFDGLIVGARVTV